MNLLPAIVVAIASLPPASNTEHVSATLYCDYPQSLKLKMASKRRNIFYQDKKQETTEIVIHGSTGVTPPELYCDNPQSLRRKMASKRRNMFHKNKTQETTERGDCGYGSSLTFAKVAGFSPSGAVAVVGPTAGEGEEARVARIWWPLLYTTTTGAPVTAECYNRCKAMPDCLGFIVDYSKSTCYRDSYQLKKWRNTKQEDPLVYTPSLTYFSKVCLPVPPGCREKAWAVQYTPGYQLLGKQYSLLTNIKDRWGCTGSCLDAGEGCSSANYHPESRACSLSRTDNWRNMDSFVPTTQPQTEYIQNMCSDSLEKDMCWREPVFNKTWARSDVQYLQLREDQCQSKCRSAINIRCVGYSYTSAGTSGLGTCRLHTDTKLMPASGPDLSPPLESTSSPSKYVELIPCIHLEVSCTNETMSVRLDSAKFTGRMYVQGHADECGVQGTGASSTLLRIVLPSGGLNPCNVHTAVAIGNVNRTLISTVLVVQYHQLIQTVNDRVVRASCLLTETSSPTPTAGSNVTLNATFSVNDSGIQSEVNGSGGSTGLPTNINATARIMLLDARTGKPAGDINLGDPLQLRIEIDPPINVSMVIVGHLIASSGSGEDSSILLLDGRGCPRDVFPPLTPLDQQTLVANFKAFRFPSSPMMTFSAVVTLCSQVCQPTDCGNNVVSYGKRRRKRDETSSAVAGRTYLEMPLHLTFVVNTPANSSLNSSHVLSSSFGGGIATPPGKESNTSTFGNVTTISILEGSDGGIEGVCLTFLTVALLSLFWLLVQCALVALCCGVMARQRRRFEEARADTVSLKHDFNVAPPTSTLPRPHQRVTWDPDIDSRSKNLRLSTPVLT